MFQGLVDDESRGRLNNNYELSLACSLKIFKFQLEMWDPT